MSAFHSEKLMVWSAAEPLFESRPISSNATKLSILVLAIHSDLTGWGKYATKSMA
jgi:hypothetical protein